MSIFPTKILLATDGSKDAQLAMRAAIELANTTGSELHAVYVGEFLPSPHTYPAGRLRQIIERVTHRARSVLGERIALIAAAGGGVSGEHVRVGRPAEEIVALAEEIGAGLIVMGSRGLGGVSRALIGSVSDSVVRHAHCPVMVVRGEENGGAVFSSTRILLATDGSEDAELAARTAADIAQKTSSELHVVHVGPSAEYDGMEDPLVTDIFAPSQEQLEELNEELRRLLDTQVERIEAGGGSVRQAHLRAGRPDAEIIALAEEIGAGLVVMGSRGLGGIRRALLGSISDSVVRHAHCPVLVVRKEDTVAREVGERERSLGR